MRNSLTAFIIIAAGLAITAALVSGFAGMTKDAAEAYSSVDEEASRLQGKDKKASGYIISEDHKVTGRAPDWDE